MKWGTIVLLLTLAVTSLSTSAYSKANGVEIGDQIVIDYTGTIEGGARDGEVFDGPRDDIQFTVSYSSLIEGFVDGVLGMKIGENKSFVVPPEKGYTQESHDLYGETLRFDVILEDVINYDPSTDTGDESSSTEDTQTSTTESSTPSVEIPIMSFLQTSFFLTVLFITNRIVQKKR